MKRFLSIALTVVMIASLCAVNINAAIDINNYPSVMKFGAETTDSAYANRNHVVATPQTGYVDFTNNGDTDAWFALNYTGTDLISSKPVLAIKIKGDAKSVDNPWIYPSTSVQPAYAQPGAGLISFPYSAAAGDGTWQLAIYTLPADAANSGVTMDPNATLKNIRMPAPAVGSNGTYSVAWFGLFANAAEVYEYDAAYSAVFTNVPATGKAEKLVTTNAFIEDNYNLDSYSDGMSLTTGGYDLRNHWTPENGQGENGQAYFTKEASGNGYALLDPAFFSLSTDYVYPADTAYTLSLDVKNIVAANSFRGMLVNYGNEINNSSNNIAYETTFPGGDARVNKYVGHSGVGFKFIDSKTFAVYAFTYGTALDVIEYVGTLPEGIEFDAVNAEDAWTNVAITDNAKGTMTFTVSDATVATLTYADAGLLPVTVTDYNEKYYRTVKIFDAEGTEKAATTEGLVSIYKTMAFGSRNEKLAFDNLLLTAPAVVVTGKIGDQTCPSGAAGISVPVTLTSADVDVISAHLKFTYPTDMLTYTGYTMGDVFTAWGAGTKITDPVDANGTIEVLIQGGSETAIEVKPAKGVLLYLNFSAVAVEADTIAVVTCESPNADDDFCGEYNGTDVPDYDAYITSGAITIAAPFVPADIVLKDGTTNAYFCEYKTDVLVFVPTANQMKLSAVFAELADTTNIKVYTAAGAEITSSSARVPTGSVIKLLDASGNTVKEYAIAVVGDVDCNGRINNIDYSSLKTDIIDKTTGDFSDAVWSASNAFVDRRLNNVDYSNVKSLVLGL